MSTAGEQAKAAVGQTLEAPSLLDQIVAATKPQSDKEAARAKDYFKQFLDQVVKPGQVISKDVETNLKYWVGEIDKKLSGQLNEIMHHEDFQKLEGTWRGLQSVRSFVTMRPRSASSSAAPSASRTNSGM